MGRYTGKSCRFLVMMLLTSSFFLVELITGYITNSLALVSDSFHMMSDIIALAIGFLAMRLSKKTTPKNTFGWQRSEVLGALVNSVFLMALCFTIFVEAIQRFVNKEKIENPWMVLIVGIIGLVVNGLGLCLFSSHGMSHGHSHGGGHGHSHKTKSRKATHSVTSVNSDTVTPLNEESDKQLTDVTLEIEDGKECLPRSKEEEDDSKSNHGASSAQLNMRGVFLHVLGDALGSVVVIISAVLIILLGEYDWIHYMDPAMSLIIVAIITITTIPLFRQSSMILLQSIPADIDLEEIERQLREKVHGIANVHELHVWQLSGNKYIATAHILFNNMQEYTVRAQQIKSYLHDQGIHSTTIQPEFIGDYPSDSVDGVVCKILCKPDSVCAAQKCCNDNKKSTKKSIDPSTSPTQETVTTADFSSDPIDQDV